MTSQEQYEQFQANISNSNLPVWAQKTLQDQLDIAYKSYLQKQQSDVIGNTFKDITSTDTTTRNVNVLNQALNAQQQKAIQGFQQRQAAQTGGRLGSAARGEQNIAGQFALAQAQGLNEIFNQQMRNKVQALNAYIAKYGIDQEALNLMKQIQAQLQMTDDQNRNDIIGSIIGAGGQIIAAGI